MNKKKNNICKPEWHSKQSPNKLQCSPQERDQRLQASPWKKKHVTSKSLIVTAASTKCFWTQTFTCTWLLAGSFDQKRWYQDPCINKYTKSGMIQIFFPTLHESHTQTLFSSTIMLPLVLLEGVFMNLLHVTFKLMLEWVNQQNVTGLLIQQLGGPRDWCQEGHQTGHTTVLKVLHHEFRCGFTEREKTKAVITYAKTGSSHEFSNYQIKISVLS